MIKVKDNMNKFMKIMGAAALMAGINTGAMAQEKTLESEKPGFFKQAFRDMKESAKLQRQIDKANFQAAKLESKAFYQEQKIAEKAMKAPYMVNVGYKTGYRADVELSWSNRAIWGISSSHGFSFGNGLYVGGGAGFSAEMTKNDEKWNASYMVPVFADIKYSFMNTLVTPFVSMKGGAIADITNTGIRTFANPAIGIDIARFSLKAGYEYQLGFWGHLDRVHSHKVKLGVAYTF